jgi:hypothetical protein
MIALYLQAIRPEQREPKTLKLAQRHFLRWRLNVKTNVKTEN